MISRARAGQELRVSAVSDLAPCYVSPILLLPLCPRESLLFWFSHQPWHVSALLGRAVGGTAHTEMMSALARQPHRITPAQSLNVSVLSLKYFHSFLSLVLAFDLWVL